jgi:hypothetical protein
MDVFEAVDTRIACRAFLNKPVDLNIVRELRPSTARRIGWQPAVLERLRARE